MLALHAEIAEVYAFVAILNTALIYGRKALKNLITYRRTGFVSYQKSHLWWLLLIVLLAAAAGGGLTFLAARTQGMNSTSLVTIGIGLFMSAAYAYGIARAIHWKWVVAAFLAICAIVLALLPEQLASTPIQDSALPPTLDRRLLGSLFWCNTAASFCWSRDASVSLCTCTARAERRTNEASDSGYRGP